MMIEKNGYEMFKSSAGEILICCLGLGSMKPSEENLRKLSPSAWERIIRQAIRYSVAPLLYHRLKVSGLEALIPRDAARKLRDSYLANAIKNLHLYQELSTIIQTFHERGLAAIVLKGAHLAKIVYGNSALRYMCDLDLLVRKEELPLAISSLSDKGYHPIKPFDIEEVCTQKHHLPTFIKKDQLVYQIELHWHIEPPTDPFTVNLEGLWQRAQKATINNLPILVLSPEDLILHLCMHTVHHILDLGLRPLCDLSETIRHYQAEIDWKSLQLRSREWKADKPLYLMLSLLVEFAGQAAPQGVLDILKANTIEPHHFVTKLKNHIMMKMSDSVALTTDIARFWKPKKPTDRIALFWQKAFPPRAYLAKIYRIRKESALVYLFYPVHIIDLIIRYGYTLWRLFRHDAELVPLAELESSQLDLRDWLLSP
ncbi:MAG: nucleotidyltransferase family protein [bacterium]|nr:nucleotidyltransferase family protein [bacterium]